MTRSARPPLLVLEDLHWADDATLLLQRAYPRQLVLRRLSRAGSSYAGAGSHRVDGRRCVAARNGGFEPGRFERGNRFGEPRPHRVGEFETGQDPVLVGEKNRRAMRPVGRRIGAGERGAADPEPAPGDGSGNPRPGDDVCVGRRAADKLIPLTTDVRA